MITLYIEPRRLIGLKSPILSLNQSYESCIQLAIQKLAVLELYYFYDITLKKSSTSLEQSQWKPIWPRGYGPNYNALIAWSVSSSVILSSNAPLSSSVMLSKWTPLSLVSSCKVPCSSPSVGQWLPAPLLAHHLLEIWKGYFLFSW